MGSKQSSVLQADEIKIISAHTGFSASQIGKLHSRFCQLDKKNRGYIGRDELLAIPELAANPIKERLLIGLGANSLNGSNSNQANGIDFITFLKNLAIFHDVCGTLRQSEPNQAKTNDQINDTKTREGQQRQKENASSVNVPNHPRVATEGVDLSKLTTSIGSRGWNNKYKLPAIDIEQTRREKMLFLFKLYDYDSDGRISFVDLRSLIKTLVGTCMDDTELDKIALRAFVEVDEHSDGFIDFGEFYQVFEGKDMENKLRVKFFH